MDERKKKRTVKKIKRIIKWLTHGKIYMMAES